MSSHFREKVALAVFAGLMVVGFCVLVSYLFAGHSWNVAASNIDDSIGSMDGYAVLVYDGTAEPEPDDAAPVPSGSPTSLAADKAEPVSADEVASSYREKGASVFVLDTSDLAHYSEGMILKRGGWRIGVVSLSSPRSVLSLQRQVAYFEEHGVDFIVAIASNEAYTKGVTGIDIVISTESEAATSLGQTVDGMFQVAAPEVGMAGVVLISPSNVVSAKTVDEL